MKTTTLRLCRILAIIAFSCIALLANGRNEVPRYSGGQAAPGISPVNLSNALSDRFDSVLDLLGVRPIGQELSLLPDSCALPLFGAPRHFPNGGHTVRLVLADFNNDGNTDIAATAHDNRRVGIFLGDGTGNYTQSAWMQAGYFSVPVVAGDFNHDGNQDLAVGSGDTTVWIYLGQGNGQFNVPQQYYDGNGLAYEMAAGDFDSDGNLDIAIGHQSGGLIIMKGNGSGGFTLWGGYLASQGPVKLSKADFNNDGKIDLITANEVGTISILLGNGSAGFTVVTTLPDPVAHAATGFAIADINGDGNQDFVTKTSTSEMAAFYGDGTGSFPTSSAFTATAFSDPHSADINGDGILDIVAVQYQGNMASIMFGDGAGGFPTHFDFGIGANPQVSSIGDLNNDGRLDIVAANYDGGDLTVAINNGFNSPDTTPPWIDSAPDITVDSGGAGTASVVYNVAASDNSGVAPTLDCSPSSGSAFALGTTPVTCTAVDACDNRSASFGFQVTVRCSPLDLSPVSDLTVAATNLSGANVDYPAMSGVASISYSIPSGSHFQIGVTNVSYTITQNCGQIITGSFNVTVTDEPPGLSLPFDVHAYATPPGSVAVTYSATAADSVSGNLPVSCSPASGSYFSVGETGVTCSATDGNGNTATGSFTVFVHAPELTGRWEGEGNANDSIGTNHGELVNGVQFSPGVIGQAFQFDGSDDFFQSVVTASQSYGGTLSVYFKQDSDAGDQTQVFAGGDCGNGQWEPTLFVREGMLRWNFVDLTDRQAYPINRGQWYHAAVTYDGEGNAKVYVNGALVASGKAGSRAEFEWCILSLGAERDHGSNFKGLVDDARSYNYPLTQSEILQLVPADFPPVLQLPDDIRVNAESAAGTQITYDVKAFDGASGPVPVDCSPPPGSVFAIGTTTVNCSATDSGGKTTTGSFKVSVFGCIACATPMFDPPVSFSNGATTVRLVSADFNHDGKPDIAATAHDNSFVGVFLGDGTGNLTGPSILYAGGFNVAIAAADFNHDDNVDLAVGSNDSTVWIFFGDGNGGFSNPSTFPTEGGYDYELAIADFNNDGNADIAQATQGAEYGVTVLIGDGNGDFTSRLYAVGRSPISIIALDLNRDGKADIATANSEDAGENGVSVLLNDGSGTFLPAMSYRTGAYPDALAASDFNSDGLVDIAVSMGNWGDGSIAILYGLQNGTFDQPVTVPGTADLDFVTAADFNGDGKTDLAADRVYSNLFTVLIGDGAGGFSSPTDFPSGNTPQGIEVVDLNLDGRQDLVTANYGSGDVTVMLNRTNIPGPATIGLSSVISSVQESNSTATVELTRSGRLWGSNSVYYSTSDGSAAAGSDYVAASGTVTFAPGEVAKSFSISITDDNLFEPDETVNITLSTPTNGAMLGSQSTASLTILNDDKGATRTTVNSVSAASASSVPLSASVADSGTNSPVCTGSVTFKISRSGNLVSTLGPIPCTSNSYSTSIDLSASGTGTYGLFASFSGSGDRLPSSGSGSLAVGSNTVLAPSIGSLTPAAIVSGQSNPVTLTVTGSGFGPGAAVVWRDPVNAVKTALTVSARSSTEITASIPASLLSRADAYQVTVDNTPANSTDGESAAQTLFVTSQPVSVTSVTAAEPDPQTNTATAATSGESGTVSATASTSGGTAAAGTLTLAQYDSDPIGTASGGSATTTFSSTGSFFDVHITSGSTYSALQLGFCDTGGSALYWFDGNAWLPVSPQSFNALSGCIDVSLNNDPQNPSSPTISQLTGTVIAAAGGPEVRSISVTPAAPQPMSSSVSLSAAFVDATDPSGSHTAKLNWGDGSVETAGAVTGTAISGSHTYTAAGVYRVTVKVTRSSNGAFGSGTYQQYVVIYDPAGGFVTGGGWINSPAGAYVGNPELVGKATFGFSAKYLKGASAPTGDTQFSFSAGGLDFRSDSYEWLVVGGAKGQFKGKGKINKSGTYGFILTAIDGQLNGGGGTDKFRIKIWDVATGIVVYDNQRGADDSASPSTGLAGGSIVIHK